MPRWDRPGQRGIERAVLDIILPENPAGQGSLFMDISIVEPTTADVSQACARARRPGLAASTREKRKHSRYPGHGLLPVVLEAGGRWGLEFRRWAKAALTTADKRATKIAELRQCLAVALQKSVAAALLGAAAGRPRPWNQ